MVEYRLPKPWVTSSNLAIRSIDYMLLFSRSFFVGGEIRRLRSYLTPLRYARNRCPTSSACHFVPADLVLHVSPSAPLIICSSFRGAFLFCYQMLDSAYRKSTHLSGKCFAGFHSVFQFFYDFTQYLDLVFLIRERQINPLLVN